MKTIDIFFYGALAAGAYLIFGPKKDPTSTPGTGTGTTPTGTGTGTGTGVTPIVTTGITTANAAANYFTANGCVSMPLQTFTSLSTASRCTVAALQHFLNTVAGQSLVVTGTYDAPTKAVVDSMVMTDVNTVTLANIKQAGQAAMAPSALGIPTNPTSTLQKLYFYWLMNVS